MLKALAKLLGVPERAAEDAIKSERLAYATLSRRQALGGLAALVTGTAFNFPTPELVETIDPRDLFLAKFTQPLLPATKFSEWGVSEFRWEHYGLVIEQARIISGGNP